MKLDRHVNFEKEVNYVHVYDYQQNIFPKRCALDCAKMCTTNDKFNVDTTRSNVNDL